MYVLIEGPDRVGKTTLIDSIEQSMLGKGVDVATIREPGQTDLGKEIREIIMSSPAISPVARMFLFLADRAETFKQFGDKMKQGHQLLISDRGYASGIAYAMMDDVALRTELEQMNELAMNNTLPHLVILIKAKSRTIIDRTMDAGTENFLDKKGVDFMLVVQDLIEFNLSTANNVPYIILEAELSKEEMLLRATKVIEYVDKHESFVKNTALCGEIHYEKIKTIR